MKTSGNFGMLVSIVDAETKSNQTSSIVQACKLSTYLFPGYGHSLSLSSGGKAFAILYSLVGMPLLITLFSSLVIYIMSPVNKLLRALKRKVSISVYSLIKTVQYREKTTPRRYSTFCIYGFLPYLQESLRVILVWSVIHLLMNDREL